MSDVTRPALSIVMLTPGSFEMIRRTVAYLAAQDVHDTLELVIVAPSARDLELDRDAVSAFWRTTVVEVRAMRRTAEGKAAGVRGASAPYVAFAEEHSWPAPGWARALIDRLDQGYAAVGPIVANPNPTRAVSWANFFLEYGPWMEGTPGGACHHLPGNNGAYRRDVLVECGDGLADALDAESVLHWELVSRGQRLFLEPSARTFHLNMSRFRSFLSVSFHYGWMFADARARAWGWGRRLFYAVGSPAIPLIRAWRVARDARRAGRASLLVQVSPALVAGLAAGAVGECLGYLADGERARARIFDLEFDRWKHLARGDQISDEAIARSVSSAQLPREGR